jgi:hypothetical protein
METDQAEPTKSVIDRERACGHGLVRGAKGMKMRGAGGLREQQDRGANCSSCANPAIAIQLDAHRSSPTGSASVSPFQKQS